METSASGLLERGGGKLHERDLRWKKSQLSVARIRGFDTERERLRFLILAKAFQNKNKTVLL